MPICAECGDHFTDDAIEMSGTGAEIGRLYRAVADGEPRREIMQLIYDLFGDTCQLRPPVDELNLARQCAGATNG
jgi:hypothetical protein